jgi:hypothetical protein
VFRPAATLAFQPWLFSLVQAQSELKTVVKVCCPRVTAALRFTCTHVRAVAVCISINSQLHAAAGGSMSDLFPHVVRFWDGAHCWLLVDLARRFWADVLNSIVLSRPVSVGAGRRRCGLRLEWVVLVVFGVRWLLYYSLLT